MQPSSLLRINQFLSAVLRTLPVVLLVWLFATAAWDRFALPGTPLADPDIWCYLNPPLSKLLGEPFQHTYGQCFLYPGMLYVILLAGADCRWITAVQHLLGLGTGALLLVAWRQVRGFLPAPRVPRSLFDAGGLAMAGVYLLSTTSTHFECQLRPEAVFPFFAVLNICCNLAFIRSRFFPDAPARRGARWWTLAAGTAAVFTCVMAWLLKPSFSAMLLLANLPVVISLFLGGSTLPDKLALAFVPTLAAALLLVLPEARLRAGDPDARSFLAESLFSVHADLIRDQMADDLARHLAAPYDPGWLQAAQIRLDQDIKTSAQGQPYPSLGFDPDQIKTATSYVGWIERQMGKEEAIDFFQDYYRRVWQRHPRAMLKKIWRQMRTFYRWNDCPGYLTYHKPDLRPAYARSAAIFDTGSRVSDSRPSTRRRRAKADRYPPLREYIAQCEELAQRATGVTSHGWVESAGRILAASYLPFCLGALLLAGTCLVSRTVRTWCGPSAAVLLLLYSYNFGTTLSLSIGHTMDIDRYGMYQLAFTLLPQAVGIWLGLEMALFAAAWLTRRYGAQVAGLPRGFATAGWSYFAADGVPLPVSARPAEGQLSVAIVTLGASPDAESAWVASCREALPGIRVLKSNQPSLEMAAVNSDVLLVAAPADAWACQPDAARALVRSYLDEPADLIIASELSRRRWAMPFVVLMELAAGRAPVDPFTGLRLLSRRFCESAPSPVFPVVGGPGSALEIAMCTSIQAIGWGFRVRELTDSPEGGTAAGAGSAEQTPPGIGERWRLAHKLFVLCCKCRPARCLGSVSVICLVLAVIFLALSFHHKSHAHRLYRTRRSTLVVSCALAAATLAGVLLAIVLEIKRRRWHADFLLRGSAR